VKAFKHAEMAGDTEYGLLSGLQKSTRWEGEP
jgi:hypothetical protein